MPGYGLVCTVCGAYLESRSGWLEHLLQEPHQRVAQAQVASWNRKIRKCCLVVFACSPVVVVSPPSDGGGGGGGGLQLMEHFSNKGFPQIVTDFVIIPSQPFVAVLQFESKEAVDGVLQKVGGPKIFVNDQMVQIRRGKSYFDLEWSAIVGNNILKKPAGQNGITGRTDTDDETSFVTRNNKRKDIHVNNEQDQDGRREAEMNISKTGANALKTSKVSKCKEESQEAGENKRRETSSTSINSKVPLPVLSSSALRSQYNTLLSEILIPDAQFQSAFLLMSKLEKEFIKQKQYPNFKLYMFRNCALGLKNFLGHSDLWFYADFQGQLSGRQIDTTLEFLDQQKIDAVVIGSTDVTKIIPPSSSSSSTSTRSPPKSREELNRNCYLDPQTGHNFRIDSHPYSRTEVQTDRLLSYLCQFDARVKPLLSIVAYWREVNRVRWSTDRMNTNMFFIPEPAVFHWLVVLFLCSKKVIPTPREIRERGGGGGPPSNQVIVVVNNVDCDIGFALDEEYAVRERKSKADSVPPDPSDDFLVDVITLAKDFFSYFAELGSGSWILNTKDGEVLSKTDFLIEAPKTFSRFPTKLTAEEMTHLMSSKLQSAQNARSTDPSHRVAILHPLLIHGRFSFCSDEFTKACPIMKETAAQLEAYLRNFKSGIMGDPISLKSMLQVV